MHPYKGEHPHCLETTAVTESKQMQNQHSSFLFAYYTSHAINTFTYRDNKIYLISLSLKHQIHNCILVFRGTLKLFFNIQWELKVSFLILQRRIKHGVNRIEVISPPEKEIALPCSFIKVEK